jgi:L-lactate dehydrogenase complex protein LldE
MRVLLFGTCLVDTFFPGVGEATVRLLRRFGATPVFPKGQTCCGQPAFNAGYEREARAAAAHFLSVFDGDDPKMLAVAQRAGERIRELSQFLVHAAKAHEAGLRGRGTITYHSSCHLTRSLGVREEPLLLLSSLKGATFVPMPDAARCCGFGGTFMAKLPEISCALAEEKAASVEATGADTVTGCDSGCLMNLSDAMRRRGTPVRVAHLAELLAEGL